MLRRALIGFPRGALCLEFHSQKFNALILIADCQYTQEASVNTHSGLVSIHTVPTAVGGYYRSVKPRNAKLHVSFGGGRVSLRNAVPRATLLKRKV